jgi:hypothetical protein
MTQVMAEVPRHCFGVRPGLGDAEREWPERDQRRTMNQSEPNNGL